MLCPLVWRCPKKKMTNFVPKNSHDNNNNSFAFQDLQSKEKKWSTSPSPPPLLLCCQTEKKIAICQSAFFFFAFSRATARRGGRYLWYREKICAPNQYWCWQGELGELSNFCQVVAVAGKATGDSTTNLAMARPVCYLFF